MADSLLLCASSDRGLVWSINCESGELAKNSLIAAVIGLQLINCIGVTVSRSITVILSLVILSVLTSPTLNLFCTSSPTDLTRLLLKWSISSATPSPLFSLTSSRKISTQSCTWKTRFCSSFGVFKPKRLFILYLAIWPISYFLKSKKRPSINCFALSGVARSPGRIFL